MGEIKKETTKGTVLRAFELYEEISNFQHTAYQPTNANNHIQLRWKDPVIPRSVHYEFLFEKQHGGYSIELHAEQSAIMGEMSDEFKRMKSKIKQIHGRNLAFYSRHRDDYGDALKISYGFKVSPEIMAIDMHTLIKKTRVVVEGAIQQTKLG